MGSPAAFDFKHTGSSEPDLFLRIMFIILKEQIVNVYYLLNLVTLSEFLAAALDVLQMQINGTHALMLHTLCLESELIKH